ncbi:MAG: hypothetical protein V4487_04005, partial [Chlamydiota bacterium]
MVFPVNRQFFSPSAKFRPGCPCQHISFYQTVQSVKDSRRNLSQQFTTMRLEHRSKTGRLKNVLDLNQIHSDLASDSLGLRHSGSSNILLSKVSFDCLISEPSREVRKYLSFDLKIPGVNTDGESVFSYEFIEKAYGGKRNLYQAMQYFYHQGRNLANPQDLQHGHDPDYNPNSSNHDQYIRHTEQLLVA